jgi:hypothetical protein
MNPMVITALIGSLARAIPAVQRLQLAALRALRTTLQSVAAAFPAAGAGTELLGAGYWRIFGYSLLAAGISGVVSFLNNIATFLPEDPTQRPT